MSKLIEEEWMPSQLGGKWEKEKLAMKIRPSFELLVMGMG